MVGNLRAAQAIATERLAIAARGRPRFLDAERIPDWVAGGTTHLHRVRDSKARQALHPPFRRVA